jgi:hypothetical protein
MNPIIKGVLKGLLMKGLKKANAHNQPLTGSDQDKENKSMTMTTAIVLFMLIALICNTCLIATGKINPETYLKIINRFFALLLFE